MTVENPGAYDESRKRIREQKENEVTIIEKKKENFEKGKEKIRVRKRLDVHELQRKIETGQSLYLLKEDIRAALESGDLNIDTYKDILSQIERHDIPKSDPDFVLDPKDYPLSQLPFFQYFDRQRLGDNILLDFGGFFAGVTQGSLFLLYILGRCILDALLLPVDIYRLISVHKS